MPKGPFLPSDFVPTEIGIMWSVPRKHCVHPAFCYPIAPHSPHTCGCTQIYGLLTQSNRAQLAVIRTKCEVPFETSVSPQAGSAS
jgi:hypothetical protein